MSDKKQILLLEDDQEDADLFKRQMKKVEGFEYELVHHTHLASVLEELGKRSFDVIVTDMNVPDGSGEELFHQIHDKTPRTPIIILSGAIKDRDLAACLLQSGAQDFFVKTNFNGELIVRSILYAQERKQLDALKDDFISFASHELRTPLTVLKCVISNMSDEITGKLNEKQKRMTDIAKNNIERMTKLINNLLDISRLESGRLQINAKPLQLASVVREVVENFKRIVQERGLSLRCELSSETPKVRGDEDLIMQVLNNLLGNSLRYAKKEIVVSLERYEDKGQKGCKVTVSNDGPSLVKEDISLLFEKFSQVNRPTGGSGYKGTGLGLALCRGILEQHAGRIWAESEEGKGVRFCFIIPSLNLD